MFWMLLLAVAVLVALSGSGHDELHHVVHIAGATGGGSGGAGGSEFTLLSGIRWALGAPLLTSVLAVFLGKYLERRASDARTRADYIALLKLVADEVERNLRLECQIVIYLTVGIRPSFGMSLMALHAVTHDLARCSRRDEVQRSVLREYYEYQHLENRLLQLAQAHAAALDVPRMFKGGDPIAGPAVKKSRAYSQAWGGVKDLARSRVRPSLKLHRRLRAELVRLRSAHGVPELDDSHLEKLFEHFTTRPEVIDAAQKKGLDPAEIERF